MPAGNPIANVFVILVGALIIAVSVVLGFVAFVVLGTIIAVFAVALGIRLWWFNRKLARQGDGVQAAGQARPATYIEGEYRVVEKDPDEPRER